MKKRKLILLNLLILFLFSFLAGTLLYGTNVFIFRQLLSQKRELIAMAEELTGCSIEYSSIRPYILNAVIVQQVCLIHKENHNLISLGEVRIDYSLLSWLRNRNSVLNLLCRISIKNMHLDTSIEDLKRIPIPSKTPSKTKKSMPDISNILFSFSKSSIRLHLDDDTEAELFVDSLRMNLFHSKANIKSNLQLKYSKHSQTIAKTSLACTGEVLFQPQLQFVFPEITFSETLAMGMTIKNQSFKLQYAPPLNFSLERQKDLLPLELFLSGKDNKIEALFTAINFSPANLISGGSAAPFLKAITNTDLSLKAEFYPKEKQITAQSSGKLKYQGIPVFGDAEGNFSAVLDNNKLSLQSLQIASPKDSAVSQKIEAKGTFDFSNLSPDFQVDLKNLNLASTKLSTSLYLKKKENKYYQLSSKEIQMNDNSLDPFEYRFSLEKDKDEKKRLAIETISPFNGISIFSEQGANSYSFDYRINIQNMYPKAFFRHPLTESLCINSSFLLRLHHGNVLIHDAVFQATDKSQSLFEFGFDFTNGNFNMKQIAVKGKQIPWNLRGRLPAMFHTPANQFNVTLYHNDGMTTYPFMIRNEEKQLYAYYAGTQAAIFQKTKQTLHISLSSLPLPVTLHGHTPKLSLKMDGIFSKPPKINGSFSISSLDLFQEKSGSSSGTFSFSQNRFNVSNLQYKDASNKISGTATASFNKSMQLDMLFTDDAKKESYTVNLQLKDKLINGKAFITNMELKKLLGNEYKGALNLRLGIKNNLLSPNISLEGEIVNGIYKNSMPIKTFFIGRKQNNKIEIDTLDFQRGRMKCELQKSSFYLDGKKIRSLNIAGDFSIEAIARRIKTSFQLTGNINSPDEIQCYLDLQKNSISYLRSGNSVRQDKLEDTKLRILRRDKRTTIETVGKNGLKMILMKNTLIANLFREKQRIAYVNLGLNAEKEIRGNIDLFRFPIEPISMITLPIVELSTGKLDGQILLSGKITDPQFSGEVALYHGNVKIPDYLSKPIIGASGIICGNGKKLSVNNVCGTCSDGLVSGYGEILFSKNKFDRYRFVVSSDFIPAHFGMSFIGIEGKGAVNSFVFEGAPKNYIFDGDIIVDQANIDINTNQIGKSSPKKKKNKIGLPIDVNLKFTSGKKVNVNYPLINATLAENNTFTLKYSDIDRSIGLLGDVKLKSGKINYLNRLFKVEDAMIQFDGTGFNPLINLTSYFSTKDKEKNNVKVYLAMSDRLLSFKTRFYSFPQLSENELNQLLGLPATQTQDSEDVFSRTVNDLDSIQNTTNYLGNTFLFSPIESLARRGLNLDTFSLNTEIFGNILSSNAELIDMLDNSSLSIGKYIFDGFYIESMMTFNKKSDTNDSIFLTLPNTNYGFNLQLQVLLELPFVSLGYSIKPRDLTNMTDMEQTISIESGFKF